VSVVTTDGVAGKHGGTVSSFCSVSADPPTMLVCLNRDSKIAKVVADNGCFNINVLCQGDSHIANRFAGLHDAQVNDRFTDIAHSHTPTGPVLESAATLSCTVQKVVCSGSHDVIFGLVQAVQISSAKPLAYCDGAYRRVIAEPPNDFKTGK
jgi:flavin reductase (DIM6/NTAB) family NADH-FMN oxidoreductase RutF